MDSVLITGVSTGIGHATAGALIRAGFHVFGSVRKQEDAERLSAEFGDALTPLLFDVTDRAAVRAAAEQVKQRLAGRNLVGLVNNAGITLVGPLMHQPAEVVRQLFEINFFGLLDVTQVFLPLLGARRDAPRPRGRIVNISSTSGRIAYPFLGAYAASKYAVEALSDSLRRELLLYDVDVIIVEPGAIQTPIWDKGEQTDLTPYAGTDYPPILARMYEDVSEQKRTALPVKRVSSVIVHALTSARPKTRYAIVDRRFTRWWLPRFLPTRWFDWAVRKHLKMD